MSTRRQNRFSVIFIVALFPFIAFAGEIRRTVEFSTSDVSFATVSDGYDLVGLPDAVFSGRAGDPRIPSLPLQFVIPANAELDRVEIIEQHCKELPGTYKIGPQQEAVALSGRNKRRVVAPNAAMYSSPELFPAEAIRTSPTGSMCGYKIAGITYYPLRYRPLQGTLRLTTSAEIRLYYKEGSARAQTLSERQRAEFEPAVKAMVRNSMDVSACRPFVRDDAKDDVNYAIITTSALAKEFEALREWKTRKGFVARVFSTDSIYAAAAGNDNAEKIRNFLKDLHQKKGLVYALLAGDYDKVPERSVTLAAAGDSTKYTLASDFYYSDLDGTWDANKNRKYGETKGDSVDGLTDIFVGRAPVDNGNHVRAFIHKDTITEKHPPAGNQKKYFLYSAPLRGYTPKHHLKDSLSKSLQDSISPGWQCANIEYNEIGGHCVVDSLSKGVALCHIASHGLVRGFVYEDLDSIKMPILVSADTSRLKNGDNPFVLFSMACFVGYFDEPKADCLAENLMNMSGGGCVAAILNSSMGLIDYNSNGLVVGYSEKLCINFNSNFFVRDEYVLGKCHAATRNAFRDYAWYTPGKNGLEDWAWACCEWNLFGDPDLPLYKETPAALTVSHAASAAPGQPFTVTVSSNAKPLAGALVCCHKDGEVHETGKTNASGSVALTIPAAKAGTMHVTVTAKNHTPYEGVCTIGPTSLGPDKTGELRTRFHSAVPTPGGTIAVNFSLAQRSDVKVQLFHINGMVQKTVSFHGLRSGDHRVNIGRSASGIVILKFSAGDHRTIGSLVFAK